MSAFTEPLAQLKSALEWQRKWGTMSHTRLDEVLAALAQVERIATDMETALKWYANSPALRPEIARAVLSAREEGWASRELEATKAEYDRLPDSLKPAREEGADTR